MRRRADPLNLTESNRQGGSVVNDILVVWEEEREDARRMAVEEGPGQPAAPNVPATAMNSILSGVRRKEDGKGRRGQPAAGAAESGDSSVRTGGQGRTGNVGKGQAGASGARHATGHQEGKGGKGGGQGQQRPQPQRSFKQPPPGSPPQVSAAEEEREARRQQAARYEATSPWSRGQTPSTGWRWGQEGQGQGARVDRRGRERCTADNPVAGCGERKGRQDRAAQRRRGTAASGREGKRVAASDVDRQAARCRAGMRD